MALLSGSLLGLSAGLSPGPLLALVLMQSVRHGKREGFKIALSPLVTDAPIILLGLLVASQAATLRPLLGIISFAGGGFVLYLAWETVRPGREQTALTAGEPRSWFKGILTNLLSPHPWLFWLTAGAATLAKAIAQGWPAAAALLFGFYSLLVGSKIVVALLAAKSSNLLGGRSYRLLMRFLAVLLVLFSLLLFREGWRQFTGI